MAIIDFLIARSAKTYIVSINKTTVIINGWKSGPDLLHQFILDCEQVLLAKDINSIRNLLCEYDLSTPLFFMKLCEDVFYDLFIQCFYSYGSSFLHQGKFFSATHFCDSIQPLKPLNGKVIRSQFPALFNEATKRFDYEIVIPYLRMAFNQYSLTKVHFAYQTLSLSRFFHLAMEELGTYFKNYLDFCAKKIIQQGKKISYSSLSEFALTKKVGNSYLSEKQLEFILDVVKRWRDKEENKVRMKLGQPLWIIPYRDIQMNRKVKLNFSHFYPQIKIEFQEYLLFLFKKGENAKGISRRFSHLSRIAKALQLIPLEINSFLDITYVEVLQIYDVLQQQKNKNGHNLYSLKTIQTSFSEARLLFDWLNNKKLNSHELLINPFRRFKFHNINSFVENAKYIPEEVAEQLSVAITECPDYVQRIWLIMMNTGIRASEALNLEEDCLVYDEKEDIYHLKYLAHKTLKQRRRMGLEDYHSVPILNKEIVEVVKQQISETEHLRLIGNTPYIFIKMGHGKQRISPQLINRYLGTTISNIINNCIKRNGIKDSQGNLWQYSNHQCRKTLAVKLLSEGSSLSEVGEILGHMVEKTTRQYYQDVDALQIAKLDNQLFEQLFETIDENTRNAYTPFEFEQLKTEIMSGSRETPEGHGSCVKHVSFGPCKKHSCVGCSLLLTGPQKLPMWKKLHNEQQIYLNEMIQMMKGQGIDDYESYRDYQAESHLLSLYSDTIAKIENFIKERMPTYDFK